MRRWVLGFMVLFIFGSLLWLAPRTTKRFGSHPQARSVHWPTVRAEFLKTHPSCAVCGATLNLEVHHVEPFHEHPERELDPKNLITLCENSNCMSHLTIGHLGSYFLSNPHIREDAALLKKRREEARQLGK